MYTVCRAAFVSAWLVSQTVFSQTYNSTVAIFDDIVKNGVYDTDVRPLKDQSKVMNVTANFQLVSIVGVDDVAQSFTINGFVLFSWKDEILTWDPSKYGNQEFIHPTPDKIWRPRVFLLNTLGARDLFQDDVAPIFVRSDGNVNWIPGNLFATSCELRLKDYPFDEQTCTINLVAMMYSTKELMFVVKSSKVKLDFFIKHSEWNLADTSINVTKLVNAGWEGSRIQLTFILQRRPTFLLINIVLPVVFLSFLNLLVFIIPADSGEKISYGITVLLALSMFLSIVSSLLPRSGEGIPKLTIYLFLLLIISMLTVIDSIMIVYLAHKNEQETSHLKAKANFQRAFVKTKRLTQTLSALLNIKQGEESRRSKVKVKVDESDVAEKNTLPGVNKYRLVSKHIDCISFIVFLLLWLLVTLGFLFSMAFGRKD